MIRADAVGDLLRGLTQARLTALARDAGLRLPRRATKEDQVRSLQESGYLDGPSLVARMSRDELRTACRNQGLEPQIESAFSRTALARCLLQQLGFQATDAPSALFPQEVQATAVPSPGDLVEVRRRQYLVEECSGLRVRLVGLDDDNQGHSLEVLWNLELGARILHAGTPSPGVRIALQEPQHFLARLKAVRWHCVTATDPELLQAPFRAGIRLFNHQLTPLRQALKLPRANLFIADDVGLGKTIEAGLILQELILRQRVDFVLVVCPAAICLQWREEMERRFGLRFEIYSREWIARRRQERGFGINPWGTHNRFIISYSLLRRPEHRDPLLQHLEVRRGDSTRARRSLLILDEAHVAAPSTASQYAVDSQITRVVRDIAPRFENRLFLSATPHNGHSNSFSALLEILDPQRFTRGVPIRDVRRLRPVMVRRLKTDLRRLGVGNFPKRCVVQWDLSYREGAWWLEYREEGDATGEPICLGQTDEPRELRLAQLLRDYTEAVDEETRGHGPRASEDRAGNMQRRLALIQLQHRLLSSIEAFAQTLELHAERVRSAAPSSVQTADPQRTLEIEGPDAMLDTLVNPDDGELDAAVGAVVVGSTLRLPSEARARALLDELEGLAAAWRFLPDARILALEHWVRRHQCPNGRWNQRRLLVFTEFADTLRYLQQQLLGRLQDTDSIDDRIRLFRGGMDDDQRHDLQRAFNGSPQQHPVRILLATDAAREGVNLQGHCADLVHFDLPWNPARLEQRNGRIDRTLQQQEEVRCGYFFYPQRETDLVLRKLVHKVDVIQRELGSLGAVLMDRLADVLAEEGLSPAADSLLEQARPLSDREQVVQEELEAQRVREDELTAQVNEAGRLLDRSRSQLGLEPEQLRQVIDVGLRHVGAAPLRPVQRQGIEAFELSADTLPESWEPTLESLRSPRQRDEAPWEHRRRPLRPVVFQPLEQMGDELVHLHLQHPFVRRILTGYLARHTGDAGADGLRCSALRWDGSSVPQVLAFARLSLFGPGAARLHDEVLTVAAPWSEGTDDQPLEPLPERECARLLKDLDRGFGVASSRRAPRLQELSETVRGRLEADAAADFAGLWEHLLHEADDRALAAEEQLTARGEQEAEDLRRLLEVQRLDIERTFKGNLQLQLQFTASEREQQRQYENDQKHMQDRLAAIGSELESEPLQVRSLYTVSGRRLEPLGLLYLWPETLG